jgi:dihydrofolate synthase/folylpolyglutamate synthase
VSSSNKRSSRERVDLGLERICGFLSYIGNPQDSFKSVIIGGTNGKGSVTFYLSNIANKLTKLRTGRYTSPHLIRITERFVINEEEVDEERLNKTLTFIKKQVSEYESNNNLKEKLTEFEILTATAFKLFQEEGIELAFIEVGLGGRLDATNVINSENTLCSIITNVSFDHMDYLGNTISEIAYEKAGIIKENSTILTAAKDDAFEVINKVAKEKNADLVKIEFDEDIDYKDLAIEIALNSWDIIKEKLQLLTELSIDKRRFLRSLQFDGRFQYFKEEKILMDGAHNEAAAKELKKLLDATFKDNKKIYIIGFLDKEYKKIIDALEIKDELVICTEPKSDRATQKENISTYLTSIGKKNITSPDIKDSILNARKEKHDLIVITGSLYLLGEALDIIKRAK